MNKTYCALPFRETMLVPGDVLLLCCRHDTNVIIEDTFDSTFKNGKIQEIRELMLAGKPVAGCEQCYREEEQGIESMREQSIKKYGVVEDLRLEGLHVQFDNLCNLKCRMCASTQSHLLYETETEVFGKPISWQKFTVTNSYKEIDTSALTELRLHGGEPFLSKRAEEFFNNLVLSNDIANVHVSIPTNGMIKPSDNFLNALLKCNKLSIWVSIDAYGKLNDYFRNKSDFDTVISNLDYFYSLIDLRKPGTTVIGVATTVNVYNVNKLQELEFFLKDRYPNLELQHSFLHGPDYLRISCLPKEYKDTIRYAVKDYPDVLKLLDTNDPNHFEEFILYHTRLDKLRQESLGLLNVELSDFIKSYVPTRTATTETIVKFHNFIDPGLFND